MEEYTKLIIFSVVLAIFTLVPRSLPAATIPYIALGELGGEFQPSTMLFVGDVMLGRGVERLMKSEGSEYPFDGVRSLIATRDSVIGNFEAAVPRVHVETPDFNFALSVQSKYLEVLHDTGFTELSLANNHSLDFDDDGYRNTIAECRKVKINCTGSQSNVEPFSHITIGSTDVVIANLYNVDENTDIPQLQKQFNAALPIDSYTIAYVHWGTEYELEHSETQAQFAYALIDMGFDAVIGHHPHVVQDIEVYNNKPIFYSLGNFIFDQYFSDDVQTGLAVSISFLEESTKFTLIPLTSISTKSQPQLMDVASRDTFVDTLLKRSGIDPVYIDGNSIVVSSD